MGDDMNSIGNINTLLDCTRLSTFYKITIKSFYAKDFIFLRVFSYYCCYVVLITRERMKIPFEHACNTRSPTILNKQ